MMNIERLQIDLAKAMYKQRRPWMLKEEDGYTTKIKLSALAELTQEYYENETNRIK